MDNKKDKKEETKNGNNARIYLLKRNKSVVDETKKGISARNSLIERSKRVIEKEGKNGEDNSKVKQIMNTVDIK